MIKRFLVILILFCILIQIPVQLSCQEHILRKTDIPLAQIDTIASYIEAFPDHTQLSIALMNDSITSFLGFLRSDGEWRVVENRDSVYEIGSITKVFTSTLLVILADKGIVSLDDPMTGILPFKVKQAELGGMEITLRTLANHTSGLPHLPSNLLPLFRKYPDNPYRDYDHVMLREYLENQVELQSVPGYRYQYSNLGVGILGYLLELRSNKSYEDLLLENIFSKYQMTSSTTLRRNISSRLVRGLGRQGEIVPNWDINALKGAEAILSTTNDLSRFAKANFGDDPILAFQREKTFSTAEHSAMALGWHILNTQEGEAWHWHNGGTGGYRSQLVMDVRHRKAVVILSNVSGFNPDSNQIDLLGFALLKTLLLYDILE